MTYATTGAQTLCAEEDSTQRLDASTTVTIQHFYDGFGRQIETVSPAPGGQYVVQYTAYDPATGEVGFQSNPYFVSGSGYAIPDSTQVGTSSTYDALGRVLTSENALSQTTTASYSIVNPALSGIVGGYYEQTTVIDANGHQSASLVDGWGRTAASETFTGNSASTYALSQQTVDTYDYAGDLVQVLLPDGTHTLTFSYDLAGRQTGMNDPDRGSESYSYDPNGNVTKTVDARGASGTIDAGYDGLDRQTWRGTNSDGSNPSVTYSYDSTASGNNGIGQLTSESFTGGPSNGWTGSYSYVYDGRGQPTASVLTVNGTPYSTSATYNDAGQPLTQTYPDGEVVATSYTSQGWLLGLSTTPVGQSAIALVDHLAYSGASGALGLPTQYGLNGTTNGDTYTSAFTYDALGRPTDAKITNTSGGSTLFETSPSYDAAGNVAGVTTTLPSGTDTQSFTYDEQNRLTAASGTGTLGGNYSAAYSYDTLNRLTSSPLGGYTYGDSAHLDAANAVGSGYTATYDASGNMVCRAPTSSATCTGSSTGQQLSYDNEGRLTGWQNAPSSPTSSANYLYDGEGNRVYAQTSSGGTTNSTTYIGQIEDVVTSGGTTTTTAYYYLGGQRVALSNNGTFSYLGNDPLGTAEVALDSSGNVTGSVLFAPYGAAWYTNGTMPGTFGYTGQRNDTAITGLNYDNARYFDPSTGLFISADPTLGSGFCRYGYADGNPETLTDSSGLCPARPSSMGQHVTQYLKGIWDRRGSLSVSLMLLLSAGEGNQELKNVLPKNTVNLINNVQDTSTGEPGWNDANAQAEPPSPPPDTVISGSPPECGGDPPYYFKVDPAYDPTQEGKPGDEPATGEDADPSSSSALVSAGSGGHAVLSSTSASSTGTTVATSAATASSVSASLGYQRYGDLLAQQARDGFVKYETVRQGPDWGKIALIGGIALAVCVLGGCELAAAAAPEIGEAAVASCVLGACQAIQNAASQLLPDISLP